MQVLNKPLLEIIKTIKAFRNMRGKTYVHESQTINSHSTPFYNHISYVIMN